MSSKRIAPAGEGSKIDDSRVGNAPRGKPVMSIPADLAADFSQAVRNRAADYLGRVEIIEAENGRIRARVQGTQLYTVNIDLKEDWKEINCTCSYAESWGGSCKHVWATLLKAEMDGLLPKLDDEGNQVDQNRDEFEEDEDDLDDEEIAPPPPRPRLTKVVLPPSTANWKKTLTTLQEVALRNHSSRDAEVTTFPADRRIAYLIDVAATSDAGQGLIVEVMTQKQARGGTWERLRAMSMAPAQWLNAPDEADRLIAQLLMGAGNYDVVNFGNNRRVFQIPGTRFDSILRRMCDTGRCGLRTEERQESFSPIQWDESGKWEFCLELARSAGEKFVLIQGSFRRGEEKQGMHDPAVVLSDGLLITASHIAPLRTFGAWPLIQLLRHGTEIKAPIEELPEFLNHLAAFPQLPRLELPPELEIQESRPAPLRKLSFSRPRHRYDNADRLDVNLSFDYDGQIFTDRDVLDAKFDATRRVLVRRDHDAEARAADQLRLLGFSRSWNYHLQCQAWSLRESVLHRCVIALTEAGWIVEAEGSIYRRPGNAKFEIKSSGIDWFELHGGIEFDGELVTLPKLLAAMQRGEKTIRLGDGSVGMLPMEWLAKYAPLAGVGETTDEIVRFGKTQVGLLDALLAAMPEARCDEAFNRLRTELRQFDRIDSSSAPDGFKGELRPYQEDGLGWLKFLQKFGFGGCLADDMGLGKTVQVLALLEERRQAKAGPALVVVPRSLVFNWKAEVERFTPEMRLLDHSGIARTKAADHFANYDLVLTTYGTLRRDAAYLKDVTFDYVILDEAQAIKNSSTEAAKATRLLRGRHRLVLSGTPIENRLADLWSLFEFLNPGMLGAVSVFRNLVGAENGSEGRELLARALRPFILRRTKEQVAKDLPEKLEQTIFCDLETAQRKLYDELRDHYRQSLLAKIDVDGLNKSKMHVLEALLRLRQAACHPGLIDKQRAEEGSAKLEALWEQLEEVLAEGHKALVFSQFTSFLSLLRKRLDDSKTTYEYLDGKTRDRQAHVERFQTDENCKLFLISLKAGGVGLNLTAADYVFLLDPWWNPAVEAQAIDRTHRIGQTRRVFAYRLIARDTVEEKVLQLQQTKRALADAIITADNSVLSKLGREDLELLLS